MVENSVDALILGCTHYPLLAEMIARVVGNEVELIDSGVEAASQVKHILDRHDLAKESTGQAPVHRFYLSDLPYKFQDIGERFLERSLPHVQTVNFEEYLLSKGQDFWREFESDLMSG